MITRNAAIVIVSTILLSLVLHSSIFFMVNHTNPPLYDTDTWYNIRESTRIALGENPYFDPLICPPNGKVIDWGILYPTIGSLFISPSDTPHDVFNKLAWLPPLMLVCFILVAYVLISRTFSDETALYSAILIVFAPGLFFRNGLYGIIDHHLLESILMTAALLCFIELVDRRNIAFALIGIGLSVLLYFTSSIWYIYFAVIACGAVVAIICKMVLHKKFKQTASILLVAGIVGYLFTQTHWYSDVFIRRMDFAAPINELQPTSIESAMIKYAFLVIPVIVACYYAIRNQNAKLIGLFAALVVLAFLTAKFARFECQLVPILCVVSAFGIASIKNTYVKNGIVVMFVITSIILSLLGVFMLSSIASVNTDWNDTLNELSGENTTVVLAWWDYGHWISAISGKTPFTDPFQSNLPVTSWIFTSNASDGERLALKNNISHIIVSGREVMDYNTMLLYSRSPVDYNQSYLHHIITMNNITKSKIVKI